MTSNPSTAPTDADAPDANQAGPAMPGNIARLLYILRILLEYGRHLLATMERRAAAPGFWLFRAVFGTAELTVIGTCLRRGIQRATALESLLLQRAAAGRDVEQSPLPAPAADPKADPCNEPFNAQIARLTAERAQHDAPADPDNPATTEQIASEVRTRPIGRTIADIRRDFGIIAMLCTRGFWDAMADAITRYEDSAAVCPEEPQPEPERIPQAQANEPAQEQMDRGTNLYPRPNRACQSGKRPDAPFRPRRALTRPRHNVPIPDINTPVTAHATGPPPRAAMKLAA